MNTQPVLKTIRRSLLALAAATLAGCPLPYEFSGEGAGQLTAGDPSSPSVTAPVQISFSESVGPSGTIGSGEAATTSSDTEITLASSTTNAVIYYTRDGSEPNPQNSATQRYEGTISLAIANPTPNNASASITINALAVGPNMRPSPITGATVTVTYQIEQEPPHGDPQRLAPLSAPQNPQLRPDQSFTQLGANLWVVTPRPTVQITTGVEPPDPYTDLPNQPGVRRRLVLRATIVNSADQAVIARTSFQILRTGAESSQSGQTPQLRLDALSSQLAGTAVEVVFDQRLEQFDSANESWTDLNDWSPAVDTPVFTVDRYDWADYTRIVPTDSDGNPGWVPLSAAVEGATGNVLIDLRPFGAITLMRGASNGPLYVHNNASVTIVGTGETVLDGRGTTFPEQSERRILYANPNTSVVLDGLVLQGGAHRGENGEDANSAGGSYSRSGGGGAAGVGGALVVEGAEVTIRNSALRQNSAVGGRGGDAGTNGTGGLFNGGDGGGPAGGNGGVSDFPQGQDGGPLSGGGAGRSTGAGHPGGDGGFGGGGGGGGARRGGGSGEPGGAGGAYGGAGGQGSHSGPAGGGGGAGLGGAIFVWNGGTLRLENVVFEQNAAVGGDEGPGRFDGSQGQRGQGRGAAVFVDATSTLPVMNYTAAESENTATDGNNVTPPSANDRVPVYLQGQ